MFKPNTLGERLMTVLPIANGNRNGERIMEDCIFQSLFSASWLSPSLSARLTT